MGGGVGGGKTNDMGSGVGWVEGEGVGLGVRGGSTQARKRDVSMVEAALQAAT